MNKVNLVNVVNMWKSANFTTYPHETKGSGERGEHLTEVFCSSRTSRAKWFSEGIAGLIQRLAIMLTAFETSKLS